MKKKNEPKILIAIITCPKNNDRQQALKQTWLKDIPENVDWAFVQGNHETSFDKDKNQLLLNTLEGYEHLARKTYDLAGFVYQETDYDFLIKIDDDSYVEVQNILRYISEDKPDYAGKRNIEMSGSDNFSYAQGGFYILSRKALKILSDYSFEDGEGSPWWYGAQAENKIWKSASQETKEKASLEDVMVGYILRNSDINLDVLRGSFDLCTSFDKSTVGKKWNQYLLRVCQSYIFSYHPVCSHDMHRYYSISQKSQQKTKTLLGRGFACSLFLLAVTKAYLYRLAFYLMSTKDFLKSK